MRQGKVDFDVCNGHRNKRYNQQQHPQSGIDTLSHPILLHTITILSPIIYMG